MNENNVIYTVYEKFERRRCNYRILSHETQSQGSFYEFKAKLLWRVVNSRFNCKIHSNDYLNVKLILVKQDTTLTLYNIKNPFKFLLIQFQKKNKA